MSDSADFEESGLMVTIREHPMASAAIAFGLGAALGGVVSSKARGRTRRGRVFRIADEVGRIVERAVVAHPAAEGPAARLGPTLLKTLAVSVAMPVAATVLRNVLVRAVEGRASRRA